MTGDGMLPIFSLWNSHFCRKMVLVQVPITSCLDSAQCLLTGLFASTFSPSDSVLSVHCQVICTKTWLQLRCFLLKMWQNLGSPNGPNLLAIAPIIPLYILFQPNQTPYCFLNSPCAFSCFLSLLPL